MEAGLSCQALHQRYAAGVFREFWWASAMSRMDTRDSLNLIFERESPVNCGLYLRLRKLRPSISCAASPSGVLLRSPFILAHSKVVTGR